MDSESSDNYESDSSQSDSGGLDTLDIPVSDYDEDAEDIECHILPMVPSKICGYERNRKENPRPKKKPKYSLSIQHDSEIILDHWTKHTDLHSTDIDLICKPFKLGTIKHFVNNTTVLEEVRKEISRIKWNKRRLDLYEFWQSDDLVNRNETYLKTMYHFLKEDVMPWMSKCTGLPLNKCSASCSAYTFGDHLLVHDDLESDRCVAFILYLTGVDSNLEELWRKEYGGALALFEMDEDGQPLSENQLNIYPQHNQFVFFQVRANSYHQVNEVLNMNHTRLSINGWFHSDQIPLQEPPPLPTCSFGLFGSNRIFPTPNTTPLDDIIAPMYLLDSFAESINKQMEENSEICLEKFFCDDFYDQITTELKELEEECWKVVGPPNRRHYETLDEQKLGGNLEKFVNVMRSCALCELLKKYTDLELVEGVGKKPTMRFEVQRWTPGSYSLMSETTWFTDSELDVIMYFNVIGSPSSGQTMYVGRSESDQEALMTILPANNSLNIIYRDEETCRIVPFVSQHAQNSLFYTFVASYKE